MSKPSCIQGLVQHPLPSSGFEQHPRAWVCRNLDSKKHLITLAEILLISQQTFSIALVKDEGAVNNFPFTAYV